MLLRTTILSLLFFCSGLLGAADGYPENELKIRISIYRDLSRLAVTTYGKVYVTELKTGNRFLLLENANYEIRGSDSKYLYIGKQKLLSPIKLNTPDGNNFLKINSRKYKGEIRLINCEDSTLNAIEEIPFEKYLYGVLVSEMGPGWPLEALKAQAVASRTYAARFINPLKDYDMTDDVSHQVYSGLEKVSSDIIEAVNSTKGEVLVYNKKLVNAFFHACCGGHTTSPGSAWGDVITKPLRGVSDPYCKTSRHYKWDMFLKNSDLLSFIQKMGSTALKIKSLKPYSKDKSGRIVRLSFSTDRGSFKAEMKELRKHFGTYDFKSTFISRIEKKSNGYLFSGRGWGHGVGMCQEGAKGLAKKRQNYKKILNFYYPGSKTADITGVLK
ncbi:MAG: hypothetical protein COT17_05860 [Elusimicrobia bacterium CG08_land_8_20_14_0_20_51_18]|nr:MAG: hypothetical protein COT17_05860 [Elusimicrobia bacterium CG08_land_8_20_14_0_20_51_18]